MYHMLEEASCVTGAEIRGDEAVDCVVNIKYVRIRPVNVTIRAIVFRCVGRIGSKLRGIIIQFIPAPLKMAPSVRRSIGEEMLVSSSFVLNIGELFIGANKTVIINRIEYAAVSAVARKNIIRIITLVGLNNEISRIRSFE